VIFPEPTFETKLSIDVLATYFDGPVLLLSIDIVKLSYCTHIPDFGVIKKVI